MRLMDLVANAGSKRTCHSDGPRLIETRGAGAYAVAIKECPIRYVLGDEIGRLCEGLLSTDAGMLDPANALLRLPAECFWLEWTRDGSLAERNAGDARKRQRIGCLINASADGRSGTMHSFWIDEAGEAQAAQVYLTFDLDHLPILGGTDTCRVNHMWCEFQALLDHVVVRVEPEWVPYLESLAPAARKNFFQASTAGIWFDLPFAFAFSAILGAQSYVATQRSNLDKLNRSRVARGRPALLDHIETQIWLGHRSAGQEIISEQLRASPRLHVVRGHMVRRHDITFWRMTHLRGNPAAIQAIRTVKVGHR
ncbi:MAG: hypothetical protein ABL919_16450 [Methylococcales bacterium]